MDKIYEKYFSSFDRKEFDEAWDKNYPKTGEIRKRMIEANRVSMDSVNPKATWL